MKILMVTSEAVPFAKTGGLADAVSALAIILKKQGHDVRIVMPRYYKIDRSKLIKLDAPLAVAAGQVETWVGVYQSYLPDSDVPVYFIDHEQAYGRDGIYGTKTETDFHESGTKEQFHCVATRPTIAETSFGKSVHHTRPQFWQCARRTHLVRKCHIKPE